MANTLVVASDDTHIFAWYTAVIYIDKVLMRDWMPPFSSHTIS